MKNLRKLARNVHEILPSVAGENTCNLGARIPEIAVKNPHFQANTHSIGRQEYSKLRAKNPQLKAKIPAVGGNLACTLHLRIRESRVCFYLRWWVASHAHYEQPFRCKFTCE